MSRRAVRPALLLRCAPALLAIALLTGCGLGDGASRARDARLVHCLGSERRAELVQAAIILDVADPATAPDHLVVKGERLTLDAWRSKHPRDFERACDALIAAGASDGGSSPDGGDAGGGSTSLGSLVAVLLPVVVGAVLAWLSAEWRAKAVTARLEADNLRSAVRGYVRACNAHARAWVGQSAASSRPDDAAVWERHDEADAQLRRCATMHARWRMPRSLRTEMGRLTETALREEQQGWTDLGADERAAHARMLAARLTWFESQTESVADAMEHPWRPQRRMRREPAPPPDPDRPTPESMP